MGLQLTEEEGSESIAVSIAGSGDGSTADRGGWLYSRHSWQRWRRLGLTKTKILQL